MLFEIVQSQLFNLACSEAVGLKDGRIPDRSFSASSHYGNLQTASHARLGHTSNGWRPKNGEVDPWLQVDLLFIRLVTGVATHASTVRYLKTYFLSFGFDADQLIVYLDDSNLPKVRDSTKIEGSLPARVPRLTA